MHQKSSTRLLSHKTIFFPSFNEKKVVQILASLPGQDIMTGATGGIFKASIRSTRPL